MGPLNTLRRCLPRFSQTAKLAPHVAPQAPSLSPISGCSHGGHSAVSLSRHRVPPEQKQRRPRDLGYRQHRAHNCVHSRGQSVSLHASTMYLAHLQMRQITILSLLLLACRSIACCSLTCCCATAAAAESVPAPSDVAQAPSRGLSSCAWSSRCPAATAMPTQRNPAPSRCQGSVAIKRQLRCLMPVVQC
jgi:hypothetical protein